MSKKVNQKQEIPEEYKKLYKRTDCAWCHQPVTQERMKDCMSRRFFPVCEKCEKKLIPLIAKFRERMAEMEKGFYK